MSDSIKAANSFTVGHDIRIIVFLVDDGNHFVRHMYIKTATF